MKNEYRELDACRAFDSYCKTVIARTAINGHRALNRLSQMEKPFDDFSIDTMECFMVYDECVWDDCTFVPLGQSFVPVKNDQLAEALKSMKEELRDILLMYWFLDMVDREIAESKKISRKTVNDKRCAALTTLKELMGSEAV